MKCHCPARCASPWLTTPTLRCDSAPCGSSLSSFRRVVIAFLFVFFSRLLWVLLSGKNLVYLLIFALMHLRMQAGCQSVRLGVGLLVVLDERLEVLPHRLDVVELLQRPMLDGHLDVAGAVGEDSAAQPPFARAQATPGHRNPQHR